MSVCPYVHVSVCPCPCAPRGPHPPPPPAPTLGVVQPPQKFRGGGGGRIAGFSPCQPVSLRCARSPSARRCISLPPPTPMHSPKGQKGRSPGVPEAGVGGRVPVLRYSLSPIPKVRGQGAALTPFLCLQGTTKKCLPRPTPRTSAGASPPQGSCGGSVGLGARGSSPGPPHLPPVLLGPLRLCPVSGVTPGLLLPHSCARGSVLTLHMDPVPCRWFHLVLLLRVPFGQQLSWRGVGMRQPLSSSPGAQLSSVASVALLSCSPTAQALLVHPARVPPPCLSFPHVGQSCAPAAHWLRAVQSSSSCGVPM